VRLALFSELRKQPLKRDDIVKKGNLLKFNQLISKPKIIFFILLVLHEHSRAFQVVFDKAQERLEDIFGMSLAELPSKEKKSLNTGSRKRKPV